MVLGAAVVAVMYVVGRKAGLALELGLRGGSEKGPADSPAAAGQTLPGCLLTSFSTTLTPDSGTAENLQ